MKFPPSLYVIDRPAIFHTPPTVPHRVYDNPAMTGFSITGGGGNFTLVDPRGFKIDFPATVVGDIIPAAIIANGVITQPCRYVVNGSGTVMLACRGSVRYRLAEEDERRRSVTIPQSSLIIGNRYLCHNGSEIIWLGTCHRRSYAGFPKITHRDDVAEFYLRKGVIYQYGGMKISRDLGPDDPGEWWKTLQPNRKAHHLTPELVSPEPFMDWTITTAPYSFTSLRQTDHILYHAGEKMGLDLITGNIVPAPNGQYQYVTAHIHTLTETSIIPRSITAV